MLKKLIPYILELANNRIAISILVCVIIVFQCSIKAENDLNNDDMHYDRRYYVSDSPFYAGEKYICENKDISKEDQLLLNKMQADEEYQCFMQEHAIREYQENKKYLEQQAIRAYNYYLYMKKRQDEDIEDYLTYQGKLHTTKNDSSPVSKQTKAQILQQMSKDKKYHRHVEFIAFRNQILAGTMILGSCALFGWITTMVHLQF